MDLNQVSLKDFEAAVERIQTEYQGNAYLTMGASLEVTPEKDKKKYSVQNNCRLHCGP